jgi:hypothetical protein
VFVIYQRANVDQPPFYGGVASFAIGMEQTVPFVMDFSFAQFNTSFLQFVYSLFANRGRDKVFNEAPNNILRNEVSRSTELLPAANKIVNVNDRTFFQSACRVSKTADVLGVKKSTAKAIQPIQIAKKAKHHRATATSISNLYVDNTLRFQSRGT